MSRIKVLIVDDSAVTRKFLTDIISSSPKLEAIATAANADIAMMKIKRFNPDVVTLDIKMPGVDGLTFLSHIMEENPMPVVMVSDYSDKSKEETIKALQLGAIDLITKPRFAEINTRESLTKFSNNLINKIFTASTSTVKKNFMIEKEIKKKKLELRKTPSRVLIAIGASAGGVGVVTEILAGISGNLPGIVIAQHMPADFTKMFAEKANTTSKANVKEAEEGDRVYMGEALIAPGHRNMLIKKDASGYYVEITDEQICGLNKPSIDVLFSSIASVAGKNSIGIILSGMGDDGSRGLFEMKESGAETIAQDKASSIVFGMPKVAVQNGAAAMVKNARQIIYYLMGKYK